MSGPLPNTRRGSFWDDPRLVFPSTEAWLALDADARAAVIKRILDTLSELRDGADATERIDHPEAATDAYQASLDDALDRLGAAQSALIDGLLSLCAARALTLSAEQQARIVSEDDILRLSTWLRRAAVATDAASLFAD